MNLHIKWILKRWYEHRFYVFLLIFMTLVSTAIAVVYPYVFKKLLDYLQAVMQNPAKYPDPMRHIYRLVSVFLAIGAGRMVVSIYPSLRALMNLTFEYVLRMEYFKDITKKDYRFFSHFRTGDLVTRLTNDLSEFARIGWFLCSGIFRAFDSLSRIVFSLVVMFGINAKLTLLSISPLPIMIAIFYFTSEKFYKNFEKNQRSISEVNNQLEMSFAGVRIIKAFVCEDQYNRFFQNALQNRFKTEMSVIKLNAGINLIYQYIGYFSQIGIVVFGGIMAVKGQISIGTFFLFYTYLAMMIYPILDLPQLFISGKQAFVCIDRLEEIKQYPTALEHHGTVKIDSLESVEFKNVSFQYDNTAQPTLHRVSFRLEKGKRVLLLGAIGSGKSTVLSLLTGLLLPSEGEILINNIPLQDLDITYVRELIGFVPQDPLLFSGSIRENIHFGNETLTEPHYNDVINAAQLTEEIEQFSQKDETTLGQRGVSVSGGQKQRIAIARALAKKPQLLILDDITASLDAQNEEKLWQSIVSMYHDVTALVISHRLSTLRYVDSVVYLNSQHSSSQGQHDELLAENDDYRGFMSEHLRNDM